MAGVAAVVAFGVSVAVAVAVAGVVVTREEMV